MSRHDANSINRPKLFINKHVLKMKIHRLNATLKELFLKFESIMMNNGGRIIKIDEAGVEDTASLVSALMRSFTVSKNIADGIKSQIDVFIQHGKPSVYPTDQEYVDYYNAHTTLHVDPYAYAKPPFSSLYDLAMSEINEVSLRDALWLIRLVGRFRDDDIDIESFYMVPQTYSEWLLRNHRTMNYETHTPPRLDEPDRFNKMLCIAAMARFLRVKIELTGQDQR